MADVEITGGELVSHKAEEDCECDASDSSALRPLGSAISSILGKHSSGNETLGERFERGKGGQPVQKDKLQDEQFEKHGIMEREKYTQWAKAFVPFVLSLQKPQNGKALHVPGFPGVPSLK